jgi:tRNA pseudouridine38-40 synthase
MHFHARYSAEARTYRYVILNRGTRSAFALNRAAFVFRPLDSDRMAEAATALVGSHDFSAFRSSQCQAKSPIRRMEKLTVVRQGEWVVIEATANAYLHHMMRNIAGLLIAIGKGDAPPAWAREVLEARDRKQNAATAPAEGLYFWGVRYPTAFALPAPPEDDPASPSRDPRGLPGPG